MTDTTEHDTGGTLGEMGSIVDLGVPAPGGAFDEHHPPDAALIGDCVHCGFCLPTCPTYVLWGEEMDSPRGRIYLMKEGLEGEPMTDSMVSHWDACLGCMACVTACPSGVQYDTLIEQTRAQVERHHERTRKDKALRGLIFSLFPLPQAAAAAARPAARCCRRTGLDRAMRRTGLLERIVAAAGRDGAPRPAARQAAAAARAHLGDRRSAAPSSACSPAACRARSSPASTPPPRACCRPRAATSSCRRSQGCCGALSVHNGREPEAQDFARSLVDAFESTGVEYVVVNAAGCGSTMKEYADLLADDPAYADARQGLRRPGPRRRGDPRRARPGRRRGTRSR